MGLLSAVTNCTGVKHFVIGLGIDAYHVAILAHVAARLFSEFIETPLSYCVDISRFVIGA